MSLPLIILLITYVVLIFLNKRFRHVVFDAFFFVMTPYVFIILLNNLIMHNNGFYLIPDNIIYIHIVALILFFLGSTVGDVFGRKVRIKSHLRQYSLMNVSYRRLIILSTIVIVLVGQDFARLISSHGVIRVIQLGDNLDRSQLSAHLTITLVPLVILLFDYYCETKKKYLIIYIVLSLGLIFSTFIKYHVISAILALLIYSAIRRPEIVKKVGLIAFAAVVVLFVSSYLLSFFANGITVNNQYYLNHFWTYVAGGTINITSAQQYLSGQQGSCSLFIWAISMLLRFPNNLLMGFFGINFITYEFSTTFPHFNLGPDLSNVVSILGATYLQGNIISFPIFMIFWGALVQHIFSSARKTSSLRLAVVGSVFLAYNMLSFFSSFFELSLPWETMIQSFLIFFVLGCRPQNNKVFDNRIESM